MSLPHPTHWLIHSSLFVSISVLSINANSQYLFGNPSCEAWDKLPHAEKIIWIKAFLVPLNLTNVARKKPKVDKFSQLPSLDPAASYVDTFCKVHSEAFASVGALKFLEVVTSDNDLPSN